MTTAKGPAFDLGLKHVLISDVAARLQFATCYLERLRTAARRYDPELKAISEQFLTFLSLAEWLCLRFASQPRTRDITDFQIRGLCLTVPAV
jgi:hypothetical protein